MPYLIRYNLVAEITVQGLLIVQESEKNRTKFFLNWETEFYFLKSRDSVGVYAKCLSFSLPQRSTCVKWQPTRACAPLKAPELAFSFPANIVWHGSWPASAIQSPGWGSASSRLSASTRLLMDFTLWADLRLKCLSTTVEFSNHIRETSSSLISTQ